MAKQQLNVALKTAIFQSGKKQKRVAKLVRISEARLSHIVRGRIVASPDEQQRIAAVVEKPVAEIFSAAS